MIKEGNDTPLKITFGQISKEAKKTIISYIRKFRSFFKKIKQFHESRESIEADYINLPREDPQKYTR